MCQIMLLLDVLLVSDVRFPASSHIDILLFAPPSEKRERNEKLTSRMEWSFLLLLSSQNHIHDMDLLCLVQLDYDSWLSFVEILNMSTMKENADEE